jgi:hypothetical protein
MNICPNTYTAPKGKTFSVTITGIESLVGPSKYDTVQEDASKDIVKIFTKKKYHYHWINKVEVCASHVVLFDKASEIVAILKNGFGDIFIDVFDPEKHKEMKESE